MVRAEQKGDRGVRSSMAYRHSSTLTPVSLYGVRE
jgi:hypothetical protein